MADDFADVQEDDIDLDLRQRYPYTHKLRQSLRGLRKAVEQLSERTRDLEFDVLGWGGDEPYGLCNELEELHKQIALLKDELGILQDMQAQAVLDKFRLLLLQLRSVLLQAPKSRRKIYHLDDLSSYWNYYDRWRARAIDVALNASLLPLRGEIERAQRLKVYQIRVEYRDGDDEHYEPRVDYKERDRIPYTPYETHDYLEEGQAEEEQALSDLVCSTCGVGLGQLHLLTSKGKPLCESEECPECHKSAVACGHCIGIVEKPIFEEPRDKPTDYLPGWDDLPF